MTEQINKTALIKMSKPSIDWNWQVEASTLKNDPNNLKKALLAIDKPVYLAELNDGLAVSHQTSNTSTDTAQVLAFAQAVNAEDLGSDEFKKAHGVKYAYHGGAMANGIASVELVIALGRCSRANPRCH